MGEKKDKEKEQKITEKQLKQYMLDIILGKTKSKKKFKGDKEFWQAMGFKD